MRFLMGQLRINDYYYIYIKTEDVDKGDLFNDEEIANVLGLKMEEYQKILNQFNGFEKHNFDQQPNTYFHTENDMIKAFKYLQEKYDILLKLLGD